MSSSVAILNSSIGPCNPSETSQLSRTRIQNLSAKGFIRFGLSEGCLIDCVWVLEPSSIIAGIE